MTDETRLAPIEVGALQERTGDVVVPVAAELFTLEEVGHPRGGRTRLVPMVTTSVGRFPVIWRSHKVIMADVNGDGKPIPAVECVLLVTRQPLVTMRAEVDVRAWEHLPEGPVEW